MRGNPFDFLLERRPVHLGGRRYLVSKPTVETILTGIALFYPELRAIAQKFEQERESSEETVARALVTVGLGRAARVLGTCVSIEGHDRTEVEEFILSDTTGETAVRLALRVVGLSNIRRIVGDLNLAADAEPGPPSEAPAPIVVTVIRIAEDFGISPLDLMSWPYEALLTVMETKRYLALPPEERPGTWVRPEELAAATGA